MMNKKAEITAEEVLKIVLAVIGIVFLLILAFQLYGMFINKTDLEQAKSTLNQIKGRIDNLEEGESDKMLITSPEGWFIVSYDKKEDLPSNCKFNECLCFCPEGGCEEGVCKNGKGVKIEKFYSYNEIILGVPEFDSEIINTPQMVN